MGINYYAFINQLNKIYYEDNYQILRNPVSRQGKVRT